VNSLNDAGKHGIELIEQGDDFYRIVKVADGSLIGYNINCETQSVMMVTSGIDGRTWSEPQQILSLPVEVGAWDYCQVLRGKDGKIHLFLLNDRHTGVFADSAGEENRKRVQELTENCLDLWHTCSDDGISNWQAPSCIFQGYVGALNSVIQLEKGRVILPFSFKVNEYWGNRSSDINGFSYWGYFRSTTIYSDDNCKSWHKTNNLKIPVPSIGTYGAVEPVVVELLDGRVWMLIRSQTGRLYESFSSDGASWSQPRPSILISSDSPVGIVRLNDNRLFVIWNNCLRFPYALGGRHVLHAAISDDEGKSWKGYREIYRDPLNSEAPPIGGDHGTAYPFPCVLDDNTVIVYAGQGEGRVGLVKVNLDWLLETEQKDDFNNKDLREWSLFGTEGINLISDLDNSQQQVLQFKRSENDTPYAAVRNFPAIQQGSIQLRVKIADGCQGGEFLLADHFSVPFDFEDCEYSLINLHLTTEDCIDEQGIAVSVNQWCDIELRWDCVSKHSCDIFVNGELFSTRVLQHQSVGGPCYLRLRCLDCHKESTGFLVSSVMVSSLSAC